LGRKRGYCPIGEGHVYTAGAIRAKRIDLEPEVSIRNGRLAQVFLVRSDKTYFPGRSAAVLVQPHLHRLRRIVLQVGAQIAQDGRLIGYDAGGKCRTSRRILRRQLGQLGEILVRQKVYTLWRNGFYQVSALIVIVERIMILV